MVSMTTSLFSIAGYMYQADFVCKDCVLPVVGGQRSVQSIEACLDILAVERNIDRYDEASFDSGDFPKVVLGCDLDGEEHCGSCGEQL